MRSQSNNSGFTFFEVLVALTIFSLLTIILAKVFTTAIKATVKTELFTTEGVTLLHLDDVLRDNISRIRKPWFYPPSAFITGDKMLTLNWFTGDKNKSLIISFNKKDSTLSLNNGENSFVFPGIDMFTIFEIDKGIKIIINTTAAGETEYLFYFGSYFLKETGQNI